MRGCQRSIQRPHDRAWPLVRQAHILPLGFEITIRHEALRHTIDFIHIHEHHLDVYLRLVHHLEPIVG